MVHRLPSVQLVQSLSSRNLQDLSITVLGLSITVLDLYILVPLALDPYILAQSDLQVLHSSQAALHNLHFMDQDLLSTGTLLPHLT